MINKRLLIKNLLAQNDEVAFMTRQLNYTLVKEKQSFKTHLRLSILTLLIIPILWSASKIKTMK
jgi:hypothetical protein